MQLMHPAAAPVNRLARAGRLIWTGNLERHGVVEVDNGKPSVGSLIGVLPGVAVDVQAYPAELAEKGLIVYTGDSRLTAAPRAEPPGAANGWNRTQFAFEPVRARQIAVIERPNASNEYQRLVLRSDARTCSVVVVEWKEK
jgi:hypothetical protein